MTKTDRKYWRSCASGCKHWRQHLVLADSLEQGEPTGTWEQLGIGICENEASDHHAHLLVPWHPECELYDESGTEQEEHQAKIPSKFIWSIGDQFTDGTRTGTIAELLDDAGDNKGSND